MARITITLESWLAAALRTTAKEKGCTLSEIVRRAGAKMLTKEARKPMPAESQPIAAAA